MKTYFNYLKALKKKQLFIHFFSLIGIIIIGILYPFTMILLLIALAIFGLYALFVNNKFIKQAVGNGIIYGGRGKGKGMLLNKRINTDENEKHFCNIPYNKKTELINISEYINSINPLTTFNFINNKIDVVKKVDKFEKVNVYWDDVSVYAPNHMDSDLKKLYPSLSLLLPINRHLYDAHMIITVQDLNRPYKLLRELQTDFSIRAVKTSGWGLIWNAIPFLNMITTTKYIFYENANAAVNGLLPFNAKSLINETLKHGYLTSGQATKETYEATNGLIRYGRVWQRKKMVNYDTRYFHKLVYGKSYKEYTQEHLKKNL